MDQRSFDRDYGKLTDPDADIRATCGRILDAWRYNLQDRKPGIAYMDEQGEPVTDLDLACALSAFADRRAVINLPTYKRRRARQVREGEIVVSSQNRHGRVIGLSSNQYVFSFSVLIEDANVMTTDSVGAPRYFMIQDLDGKWYEGWHEIQFLPDQQENKLVTALAGQDGKIRFRHFIHPLRWTSFYGRPYLLAKIAISRLEQEMSALNKAAKKLREELAVEAKSWPKTTKVGEEKKIPVAAFTAIVDGITMEPREVPELPVSHEALEDAESKLARMRHLIRDLRFQTRATEYSFWENAVKPKMETVKQVVGWLAGDGGQEPRKTSWVAGKEWTTAWRESDRAKIDWARMEIVRGLWLRWRVREKTESVAA